MVQVNRKTKPYQPKVIVEFNSAWEVLLLSFRILYKYLHFWIRLNLRYCLYSLPILT